MNPQACTALFGLLILVFQVSPSSAKVHKVPQEFQTIQAAIDASAAGDVVLVSPGTYRERIRLAPHITVRSAGTDDVGKLGLLRAEATMIDGGKNPRPAPGVLMAEGATLDGFTVTGVGLYDDALWNKHHKTKGDEQSHDHIGHFGSPGIGIVGVTCTVINNIVHHNGDTGIGVRGVKNQSCAPRVANNVCYRNMGGGIGSMNGSTAIIDRNTCFQNFYAGIGHDAASPVVTHNTCYENIRAGIGVSEGARPVVRGNTCYRNRRAGIGVRTGGDTSPVIEDNDCYENDMAGIGCEEQAAPIIRNNRCYRNAMAGIGAQAGARPVIVDNECYENKLAGIGVREKAQAVIVRNRSRQNETAGIGIRSQAVAVVCHNECTDNKLVAIGLPDGASAVLYHNELSRTGGMPPLVAVKGGSTAVLADNTLKGGGVAGVLVQGRALLTGNRFQGQGPGQGSAVWVWANSIATVHDNEFDGYRNAVNASGSQVLVSENTVRDFQKAAIIVKKSSRPAHVFGNTAVSQNANDAPAIVEGPAGVVADNKRVAADKREEQ